MKTIFISLICFGLHISVFGQNNWSVALISDELREDAASVVRKDVGKFEIKSVSSAHYTSSQVITIYNAKAKNRAMIRIPYDKDMKIKTLEAKVYDANGKEIKKIKKADFNDNSYISGFSLYEDTRVKFADLSHHTYPYTIEVNFQYEFSYIYKLPTWKFISNFQEPVQFSSYTIWAPSGLFPNYKVYNFIDNAQVNEGVGFKEVTWTQNNLKAIKKEPYTPNPKNYLPMVEPFGNAFEYAGYRGDMSSWESFGNWIKLLNSGRDQVPAETVRKIKEITDPLESDRAKIQAVYEYLQNKTRYVSIQLGIGGLQTFEASLVDRVGYGDCKALTNYTYTLLKTLNIPSIYTLVMADDNPEPLSSEYVNPAFNHVILCVPNKGDTIWLECTSQTQPFGFLGSFTDDRDVLLVTDNGGVLARTPRYHQDKNQLKNTAHVVIDAQGNAKAEVNAVYSGLQTEYKNLNFNIDKSAKEQKEWIYKNSEINNLQIDQFRFSKKQSDVPLVEQQFNGSITSLATVSGKRIFIQPNLMNKFTEAPLSTKERKLAVLLREEYIHTDSITYTIPSNIYPEYLPETISINSVFGDYKAEFHYQEGQLIYKRTVRINKGEFPASEYNNMVNFYKEMVKADKTKVVFNNRT